MGLFITFISITVRVLTLLIFIYSLLSFFLSPYHPVQRILAQVVEPMLVPIRKWMPSISGIDLSPFILMVLIQILGSLLVALLRSLS